MKNSAIKHIVIIWTSIILIFILLKWGNIWSHSILFENIQSLIIFFGSIIIPVLAIILIKRKLIRYILLTILFFGIILLAFPLTFVGMFLISDLKTGNGFQKIHEQPLNEKDKFVIYITPDKGALGGSNKIYSVDRELIWGFHTRKRLKPDEYNLIQSREPRIDTIFYRNETIIIDYNEID